MVVSAKKPDKVRVCHDARAPVNGVCLNEQLHGGPDFVNNLVGVLLRFRRHKVALTSDIRAFYHQVLVHPDDRWAFQYLWFRCRGMNKADRLRFLGHIFGAKSSSTVCTFALKHHAMLQ